MVKYGFSFIFKYLKWPFISLCVILNKLVNNPVSGF